MSAADGPAAADAAAAAEADKPSGRAVKPLFRPHLPANPETILDPDQEPAKPKLEPNPLDEDERALKEFEHESEAISDRTPLGDEEMFAYWRLMGWSQSQTAEQMLKRARGDVRYSGLLSGKEYRGDLIKLNLHIRRVLR